MGTMRTTAIAAVVTGLSAAAAMADDKVCRNFGPQTPRDISSRDGGNMVAFPLAPPSSKMNLCNIHFHLHAEHKGPGFTKPAKEGGGFVCNDGVANARATTRRPLLIKTAAAAHVGRANDAANHAPAAHSPNHNDAGHAGNHSAGGHAGCEGIQVGDTIEVHWVYSTCDVKPGKGLAACSSPACANPTLRVESQVFLVTDGQTGLSFDDFDYPGKAKNGLHQPRALPDTSGKPVVFRGSTTGPSYDQVKCSPLQATWSVRPQCAKINFASLNHWCASNTFEEHHGHGVRALVTARELLDKIDR